MITFFLIKPKVRLPPSSGVPTPPSPVLDNRDGWFNHGVIMTANKLNWTVTLVRSSRTPRRKIACRKQKGRRNDSINFDDTGESMVEDLAISSIFFFFFFFFYSKTLSIYLAEFIIYYLSLLGILLVIILLLQVEHGLKK